MKHRSGSEVAVSDSGKPKPEVLHRCCACGEVHGEYCEESYLRAKAQEAYLDSPAHAWGQLENPEL